MLRISRGAILSLFVAFALLSWSQAVHEETKTLDQLLQDAIKEGGKLVIYHGGDTPNQQDMLANAFRAAYPKINLTMVVDYSKYHDARVDNLLETNSVVPDIVALQTLQDYPRWKEQGKLLNYKPAGFSKIYNGFTDSDGAWISHFVFTFGSFYDETLLKVKGLPVPQSVKDLVNPIYKGHIASTYPHDDDAALFVYKQYIDKYGWNWVKGLASQRLYFKRGSNTPGDAVEQKKKVIGMGGSPNTDIPSIKEPYLAWGQRMSILKKAPHPAAAKLFMNWVISTDVQKGFAQAGLSTRTDTAKEPHAWNIPEASVNKFPKWMEHRDDIERLKATLALYFGEVVGKPSPGQLGLHPGL